MKIKALFSLLLLPLGAALAVAASEGQTTSAIPTPSPAAAEASLPAQAVLPFCDQLCRPGGGAR